MAFTWQKPLGEGVVIYLDTILEIRQNVDYVDDNKCNPHCSSVLTGHDETVYSPENGTYKGAEYFWDMSDHDKGVLIDDDGTIYSDDKYSVDTGDDSYVRNGHDGTYCSVDDDVVNSPHDSGANSTDRDHNSDYDSSVLSIFA